MMQHDAAGLQPVLIANLIWFIYMRNIWEIEVMIHDNDHVIR